MTRNRKHLMMGIGIPIGLLAACWIWISKTPDTVSIQLEAANLLTVYGKPVEGLKELRSAVRPVFRAHGATPVSIRCYESATVKEFQRVVDVMSQEGFWDFRIGFINQSDEIQYPTFYTFGDEFKWDHLLEFDGATFHLKPEAGVNLRITSDGVRFEDGTFRLPEIAKKLTVLTGTETNKVVIYSEPDASFATLLKILFLCRTHSLEPLVVNEYQL